MGKLFAVVLTLITLTSAAVFMAHVWWMPPDASAHGPGIDSQMNSTFIEAGIAFVLSQLLLAYFVWKYRDGAGRTVRLLPGGAKGTVITAFLLVGLELLGLELVGGKVWASLYYGQPVAGATRVQVQAEQFGYYFRYPGPDGKFGPLHPDKIDPGTGNFFGLDKEHDVESRDDIVTAELTVPVNQAVDITLHSKDVDHSFYVPSLRVHQDFLPGMEIPVHFTPVKVGRYDIVWTQLCGLGHYNMHAFMNVMSEADYEKWLQDRAAEQ
jgi:cytochrome c oxidase subunit 2